MKKLYVFFHSFDNAWYNAVVSKLRKTNINHCGIIVELSNKQWVLYNVGPYHKLKYMDGARYLERYPPTSVFYMGTTDIPLGILEGFIQDQYKIIPWKLIFWQVLGRFIFPQWIPKSCAAFASNYLQKAGHPLATHVAPDDLLKELKDADNYAERKGKGWKDFLGTTDC